MIIKPRPQITNSKGEVITLNQRERAMVDHLQQQINNHPLLKNDLGYEVQIDTLTTIVKKVTEQKFYTLKPGLDAYVPMKVGEGAFGQFLTTYKSYSSAGKFEDGIINQAQDSTKMASANVGIEAVPLAINNWAMQLGWNIFQLEQAQLSGNWELVSALEEARKTRWDLGIQRVMGLGLQNVNSAIQGLLNLSGVNINSTVITKPIGSMTAAELKTFCGAVVYAYFLNTGMTEYPTHFVVPVSDHILMATTYSSPDFPIAGSTVLEVVMNAFKQATGNADFQILPMAYADTAFHTDVASIAGKQVYALYNHDEKTIRMNIPVDYTATMQNTLDGFNLQNVAYGQFTGVTALRPKEILYFQY